jgi:Ca2+-binding EF-hand superfamily protein
MELTLQSVEGVPDGSVLSIKIGDTKRQGPTGKLGQPFRFASSLAEPLPMKVEILTPAAPAQNVKVDPVKTVQEVRFSDKMKVTLIQRDAPELRRPQVDVNNTVGTNILPADKLETAQTAAAYLERHDLVRTFQDILHGLLVVKPSDPFAYVEDHVARAKAMKGGTTAPPAESPGTDEAETRKGGSNNRGSIVSRSKVDALLDILQKTNKNLPLVMPFLPKDLSDVLVSSELADECQKQFRTLDKNNTGKLGPEDLIPVIVQLSTASTSAVTIEQANRFIRIFDANEDGSIQLSEFTMLTQFVIVAAHLESPDGQSLLEQVRIEDSNFKDFLDILEQDKDRINEVVPFLPDWLVVHLTSEKFMQDCNLQFDALDNDKSGVLEPLELIPVVNSLTKTSVDLEKCRRFVKVFDVYNNGVIMRDEFVDFAQFLAVMNFLSTTVEGQSVAQASLEYADRLHWEKYMNQLAADGKCTRDVFDVLPKALVDDITSSNFASQCSERFVVLDRQFTGVVEPSLLFPLITQLCTEHPIHLDMSRYTEFFRDFDKNKTGCVQRPDVVEFAKFIVVMAYLRCCWEWHDVKHSRKHIEELLSFLKSHAEKIDDIIPYLPIDLKEELLSPEYERNCLEEFRVLDKAKTGVLEPKEVVPLIIQMSSAHRMALTEAHILEFVNVFDTKKNGVITPSEYVDFSRFMMILAYLETEEGQLINDAAEMNRKIQWEAYMEQMKTDGRCNPEEVYILPHALVEDTMGATFARQCQETFASLDKEGKGVLEPSLLFPLIAKLCSEHPIHLDNERYRLFFSYFDKGNLRVVRRQEVVEFAKYVVVLAYLMCCWEWHVVKHDQKHISELLAFLKSHVEKIDDIIPYLPPELKEELTSKEFTAACMSEFKTHDTNNTGVLEPALLVPLILNFVQVHHMALTYDHVMEFLSLFDSAKNGVITPSEYVDFKRFIMILTYLETEEGQLVNQAIDMSALVQKSIDQLRGHGKLMPEILNSLPKALAEDVSGDKFSKKCKEMFVTLDRQRIGELDPSLLYSLIMQLCGDHPIHMDEIRYKETYSYFAKGKVGVVQRQEVVEFAKYAVVMGYLLCCWEWHGVKHDRHHIEELLNFMKSHARKLDDILPFIPSNLKNELTSAQFEKTCMEEFRLLDKNKSGVLEPDQVVPLILQFVEAHSMSLTQAHVMEFVNLFDLAKNGVITPSEYVNFSRFIMILAYLETEEGRLVNEAADMRTLIRNSINLLKTNGKVVPEILSNMPKALVEDVMSDTFARKCKETFVSLDRQRKGVIDPSHLFSLVLQLTSEHPIHLEESRYKDFFRYFDKSKAGVVTHQQVVEFAKFAVVFAYLMCCWEWHDVKHERNHIEELLSFLKSHAEKIDDIIPYLPSELKEELTSSRFERDCMGEFKKFDKDKSGVLEPKEVAELIVQFVEAHQMSLTQDHVMEFVRIFDTKKNGVITPSEFVDFCRFMTVMAYLETEEGQFANQAADISAGARKVDELLEMLRRDRGAIHKVIHLLPGEIFNQLTGDAFILQCEERFAALDADRSGVLEPKELYPVVVELSKAHPHAIDFDHCRQFTEIFDVHKDGVIRKDEFVDFARFLCVMSYLNSEEGKVNANEALKVMSGSKKIEELLVTLERDRNELRKVIPYLPEYFRDEIISQKFADKCRARYMELDKQKKGYLDSADLIPTILDMTGASHLAVDESQCRRFIKIFDDEKTGVISLNEYVNFARFVMVMSYLQTADGKLVLELAGEEERRQKHRSDELAVARPGAKAISNGPAPPAIPNGPRSTSPTTVGHMQVDLEFYQSKSEKLVAENTKLRNDLYSIQESMRRMESRMEQQEQKLRHAELDLKKARQR